MYAEAETTPSVRVSYKAVPEVHKDSPALDVLGSVLNGRSGRLYKDLVLKQKVATNAGGYAAGQKYAGTFVLTGTSASDKKPEDVEKALYAEIEKIQKDGISETELQKVKNQSLASSYARIENNMGLMIQLASSEAAGTYKDFLDEPKQIQAVTRADVQRVAKQYLTRENRNVLIYTRKGGAAPVDPELAKLPEQMQAGIQAQLAQIEKLDLPKLKEVIGQMEGQVGQVPEQVKPAIEYMLKKLRARVQKLETK
jgi:predicted Zn-dependent peptidase